MIITDSQWMKKALELATIAYEKDEVPVGAIIVSNNELVSEAYNLKEATNDPLGHAELIAIDSACLQKNIWRLNDCTLYVTLEPCLMCVGAIAHARIGRLVYGARDPKAGAIESIYKIFEDKKINHKPEVVGGVLGNECSEMLSSFFKKLRASDAN